LFIVAPQSVAIVWFERMGHHETLGAMSAPQVPATFGEHKCNAITMQGIFHLRLMFKLVDACVVQAINLNLVISGRCLQTMGLVLHLLHCFHLMMSQCRLC